MTTEPRTLPLASLSLLMVATKPPLAVLMSFVMMPTAPSKDSISNSSSPERMMTRRVTGACSGCFGSTLAGGGCLSKPGFCGAGAGSGTGTGLAVEEGADSVGPSGRGTEEKYLEAIYPIFPLFSKKQSVLLSVGMKNLSFKLGFPLSKPANCFLDWSCLADAAAQSILGTTKTGANWMRPPRMPLSDRGSELLTAFFGTAGSAGAGVSLMSRFVLNICSNNSLFHLPFRPLPSLPSFSFMSPAPPPNPLGTGRFPGGFGASIPGVTGPGTLASAMRSIL